MLSFNAIPKYRDKFYDPDPEKKLPKLKAKPQRPLENNKESTANNSWISSTAENSEVLFPTDEVGNEVFNNNFSVLPNFVMIDTRILASQLRSMVMLMLL